MNAIESTKADKLHFVENASLAIFAAALPFSVSLIQGGILLFIAASLFRNYKEKTLNSLWTRISKNPLLIPWLIYLVVGVIAASAGVNPARSFASLNSDLLTAVTFFGLCLFLRPKQLGLVLFFYLAAVTVAALWGVFQSLNGLTQGLNIRAHAAAHPVRFGEIMTIGLALALSRIASPKTHPAYVQKLLYTSVLVIISAIVLSQTRGAYLGTALVVIVLFSACRPTKRAIISLLLAGALLGVALAALNPEIRQKFNSILPGASSAINRDLPATDSSINTRLALWELGFRIIKDHPLLGVGPANVKKVFLEYCPGELPGGGVWGSLHNLYIHQTAERGLLGLAALLILFTSMLTKSFRAFQKGTPELTLWALTIMPAWFLMNLTEITFQHVHTSYAVLLAVAISITAQEKLSADCAPSRPTPPPLL